MEDGYLEEDRFSAPVELSKKEKRRQDLLERLERLQRDFAENKEKIFLEKLAGFKREIKDLQDGSHPDFREKMKQLIEERDELIRQAELFRDYQLHCATVLYEAEKASAQEDYHNEKQGLKEKMLLDLENKRRKLREERENFDVMAVTADGAMDQKARATRRNPMTKGVGEERKERRRKQQQGPQCPYLLKDSEIHEDLNVLRRVRIAVLLRRLHLLLT
ncbi:Sds3-like protein [Hyaloraphidium curvatum]|nr:Sds3-like protein [Hyaloraphidium curvatum]